MIIARIRHTFYMMLSTLISQISIKIDKVNRRSINSSKVICKHGTPLNFSRHLRHMCIAVNLELI